MAAIDIFKRVITGGTGLWGRLDGVAGPATQLAVVDYTTLPDARPTAIKSANYAQALTDNVVAFTATANYTLLAPAAADALYFTIVNLGIGTVTIVGTINNVTNFQLTTRYQSVTLGSINGEWVITAAS